MADKERFTVSGDQLLGRVKQLIQEVHRRSLWQVLLAVYAGASWAVFQVT